MSDKMDDVLCHLYKVLCDDVPNCGCNEPEAAHELVYQLLRLAPFYAGTWKQARELIGSDGAFQIVIAALTGAKLLEHGGTLGGSWLTDKGRWALWAVEQVGGIDVLDGKLEFAGYPHHDVECTDACWVVPDGWEPAPVSPLAASVLVPCPGPSCPQYLYGAPHEHAEEQR